MTIKVLAFGEAEQVGRLADKSRGGHSLQAEEAVSVDTVTIADSQFLLFSVRERALVSEQATGTNGTVFPMQDSSSSLARRLPSSRKNHT